MCDMRRPELFLCDDDGTDNKTFEALYRKISPRLQQFVRKAESYEAEDICAEVWMSLLRYIPRFRGDAEGFEDLAFNIARRRIIDHRRRRLSRQTDLTDFTDFTDMPEQISKSETEAEVLARLRTTAAYEYLLKTLTPEQVEVVVLRIIHDMSPASVAEVLGRSPGSVRILHHRALKRLRQEDPEAITGVAGA